MSAHTMARRYGNALFDVAKKSRQLEQVERNLTDFVTLVEAHPDLQRAFASPAIPTQKKRALLDALLEKTGLEGEVRQLLRLLADRDRLGQLSEVLTAFAGRLRQERHVVQAQVVTASPLDDGQRALLEQALRDVSGADVAMSERVDPSIIGGVVAQLGSLVLDASVKRQLERMKQRLTEAR